MPFHHYTQKKKKRNNIGECFNSIPVVLCYNNQVTSITSKLSFLPSTLCIMDQLLRDHCGIAQIQARLAFIDDGYDDPVTFARNSNYQIESYVKTVNKMDPIRQPGRGNVPGVRPKVPNASVVLLKALRLWTIWQQRLGLEPIPGNYNDDEASWALERFQFEAEVEINKETAPPTPDKFTNFVSSWRMFKDGVFGMLFAVRGCMNIPLLYVLRDDDVVTDEVRNAEYDDTDRRLMALVAIEPPTRSFKADNVRVWNLIHPLLHNTNAWEYIKQFERSKNARAAWKILVGRGEGEAQRDTKQVAAERALMTLMWDGTHKRYTWSHHLNKLLRAFNDLDECGKAKTDYDKVTTLFHTCKGEFISTIRTSVFTSNELKNNFEACVAHIETQMQYHPSFTNNPVGDRNVSSATTKHKFKFLPKEQWQKMSQEEKDKYKNEQKNKVATTSTVAAVSTPNTSKKHKKKQRKMASLAQEILDDAGSDSDEEKPVAKKSKSSSSGSNSSPADQFGRQASALQLAKMVKQVSSAPSK
jgi:hypothetical protein